MRKKLCILLSILTAGLLPGCHGGIEPDLSGYASGPAQIPVEILGELDGETRQALYSYYLRFDFQTDAGILEYLRGREFQVDRVPFAEKYFPGNSR